MKQTRRYLVGAGVGLVATAGGALAGAMPGTAQDGLARATSVSGLELPASPASHPTADDHPGGGPATGTLEVEAPAVEAPAVEAPELPTAAVETSGVGTPAEQSSEEPAPEPGGPPADTHGAAVSAVARDRSTTGAEHGEAVSAVAGANDATHGPTPGAEHGATPGTVPDQASDAGVRGAAHAQGRGRP